MPCTAKKYEADRPEMRSSGYKDIDYVLTTRELAVMIRQAGIDFHGLEDEKYDSIMGASTGAAVIFGATGGVMEAALRTAYEIITGRSVPFTNLEIIPVRGMEGVKEATIKIEGTKEDWKFLEGVELKVAIAHGLVNANKLVKGCQHRKGFIPLHRDHGLPRRMPRRRRPAHPDKPGYQKEKDGSYLFGRHSYGNQKIA